MTVGSGLLPCPFCGGKAAPQALQCAEDAEEAWVSCLNCGASTDRVEDAYADNATARDLWNLRAKAAPSRRRRAEPSRGAQSVSEWSAKAREMVARLLYERYRERSSHQWLMPAWEVQDPSIRRVYHEDAAAALAVATDGQGELRVAVLGLDATGLPRDGTTLPIDPEPVSP